MEDEIDELALRRDAERDWGASAALRAEFGGNFDDYQAYLKIERRGQARLLRGARNDRESTLDLPLDCSAEDLAEAIVRKWKTDASIRAQFGDSLADFSGFEESIREGRR